MKAVEQKMLRQIQQSLAECVDELRQNGSNAVASTIGRCGALVTLAADLADGRYNWGADVHTPR